VDTALGVEAERSRVLHPSHRWWHCGYRWWGTRSWSQGDR